MLTERKLRKHVAIIHAYSQMSALQRKVVNVLLFEAMYGNNQIMTNSSVAIECSTSLTALAKTIRFNSKNRQYLKEAIDGLASLEIEWNLLRDKVPTDISFLNLRVLHGPPTFFQDGRFNYSFHKVMLDLIEHPSIYGTLDLEVQALFESKYAHALFENGTRFVNLHKNKVIQLDTFRKMLGVHPEKYASMREFTRNVIKPAVEEVNDRAGFVVSLDSIRTGKKIEGFEISVQSKLKSIPELSETMQKMPAYKAIKETFGEVSVSILKKILDNYTEVYILEKVAYTKQQVRVGQSGLYPIPYFIKALQDDYKFNQENGGDDFTVTDEEKVWRYEWNSLQFHLSTLKRRIELTSDISYVKRLEKELAQHQEEIRRHWQKRPQSLTQVS